MQSNSLGFPGIHFPATTPQETPALQRTPRSADSPAHTGPSVQTVSPSDSQETPAGQPKTSAVWVNYQHGVNLAQMIAPGSSARMSREELIAYPTKMSAEAVTPEQKLVIAGTRVGPTLEWAVANGIIAEQTHYTEKQIHTASSALDQYLEDMAHAISSLAGPVPTRKNYFTGTQMVSPIKGHDDPNNKKYPVALYDDKKFGDDFKADLASKKNAYGTLIKQLFPKLPMEDRIAIEYGKVGIYALKPPPPDNELERGKVLIKAVHNGKTTAYEIDPERGTARRRDDYNGVFNGSSAIGKRTLPDGTEDDKFTAWEKPSIQETKYQPKVDQQHATPPDNQAFRSKLYSLELLSEFPESPIKPTEQVMPNTMSSARFNDIAQAISSKLFYVKDLDLLEMAEDDPERVTPEEKEDRENYKLFKASREHRREFLKGFVPFWQGVEAIVAGRPIEGLAKIWIDILSFMLPIEKVATGVAKVGIQLVESALPKLATFTNKMFGFTRSLGVPGVKWEGGVQGLKWTQNTSEELTKGVAQFKANAVALSKGELAAREINFKGKKYFVADKPDAGDGVHYLLRIPDPKDPTKLVSSSIVAKPDGAGVWNRRGDVGGGVGSSTMRPSQQPFTGTPNEIFIEKLLQQRNAMPGARPRITSLEGIKKENFSVPPVIYRAHTAAGDSAATGLRRAAGTTTSGDDYLAAIIKHTARQGGSGGEVMSFSASRSKVNSFAKQYSKDSGTAVPVFTVNTSADKPAFRTAADIILNDGKRLVEQRKITPATLLQAIDQLANKELEVFYIKGDVPGSFLVS